jgi:FeS assembly SUF system regulator
MLRMSKLTDYGTVVMTYLARNPSGIHTANEIADEVLVALPTTSKLLKLLARAGLVTSTRGTHGGYLLARPATEISIAQVIAALEGPIGLTECASAPGACEQESGCTVSGNWQRINKVVVSALQQVTLAEMVAPIFPVDVSRLKNTRRVAALTE